MSSRMQVVKGFVPVDSYGNPIRTVTRTPEISIEGMPNTKRKFVYFNDYCEI